MEYRLEITPRARREIDEACEWIAQHSPRRSVRWREGLERKIDSLTMLPERYGVAVECEPPAKEVRELVLV